LGEDQHRIPNLVSKTGDNWEIKLTPISKSTSGRPVPFTENPSIQLILLIIVARSTLKAHT
jgi:hypothetical protein